MAGHPDMSIHIQENAHALKAMARLVPHYLRFDRSTNASGTPEPILYWRCILRARGLILACGLAGCVLAACIAYSITPVYQATAMLLVSNEQARILAIGDSADSLPNETQYMTQYEYLRSYQLGQQVIKSLVLWQQPGFAGPSAPGWKEALKQKIGLSHQNAAPPTPDSLAEASWLAFSAKLSITPIPDSRLIAVSFESTDPDLAATVANRVVQTYLDAAYATQMTLYEQIRHQLSGQETRLLDRLQGSQDALQQFRNRRGILNLGAMPATPESSGNPVNTGSKDKLLRENPAETAVSLRIAQLTARLTQARQRRIEIESTWQQANEVQPTDYGKLPGVTDTPGFTQARQQLDTAEMKLAEFGQRYGPEHPRIREALAQRHAAEENLGSQARIAITSLTHELNNAKASERVLGDELAKARNTLRQLNNSEAELNALQREKRADRQRYDITHRRNSELSSLQQLRIDPARLIQTAMPEIEPVRPNHGSIALLGLLAGLILSSLGVLLRERFWLGVRNADDAERLFALPVLVEMPSETVENGASDPQQTNDGGFPEIIRTLRSAVLLSDVDRPQRSLLVTSSVPGEGKSTVSLNLAFSLAQVGTCLLIDADLRRAGLSQKLGMPRHQDGLVDYLTLALDTPGLALPENFIQRAPGSALDVMPAGAITEHPLELLQSRNFRTLLATLGERYQSIVIDSPPLAPVSDALLIASLCNYTLHVLRSGSTQSPLARRALQQLRRSGAHVLGIVLNAGIPAPHLTLPGLPQLQALWLRHWPKLRAKWIQPLSDEPATLPDMAEKPCPPPLPSAQPARRQHKAARGMHMRHESRPRPPGKAQRKTQQRGRRTPCRHGQHPLFQTRAKKPPGASRHMPRTLARPSASKLGRQHKRRSRRLR